jgi:hypothetical protein
MKKALFFIAAALMFAASFSQDVRKKIEEQAKDPKTKENADKADVLLIDKKKISDTAMVKHIPPSTSSTVYKPVQKSSKKKVKKH